MKTLRIKYKATAPISHIGEIASTGSYFQTIKTSTGRLPIITANSVRGILRDSGAKFLLDRMGCKVDKEIFHILFSGGNLNGTMKNDVAKAKSVREHFPFVSVFGGGLGDMILAGKMAVGNLYPICKESETITGIDSEISYKNLIDEIEYTRTDDGKDDILAEYILNPDDEQKAKASTQMRYAVQYMAAGTEFVQTISLFDNILPAEEAALFSAFLVWFNLPKLGGMANKGFGFFDAETNFGINVRSGKIETNENFDLIIKQYADFIDSEGYSYLDVLRSGKSGKR